MSTTMEIDQSRPSPYDGGFYGAVQHNTVAFICGLALLLLSGGILHKTRAYVASRAKQLDPDWEDEPMPGTVSVFCCCGLAASLGELVILPLTVGYLRFLSPALVERYCIHVETALWCLDRVINRVLQFMVPQCCQLLRLSLRAPPVLLLLP